MESNAKFAEVLGEVQNILSHLGISDDFIVSTVAVKLTFIVDYKAVVNPKAVLESKWKREMFIDALLFLFSGWCLSI